jgi:endonuclease/exonuclease/phosphatase family metal-dependent hydrolase
LLPQEIAGNLDEFGTPGEGVTQKMKRCLPFVLIAALLTSVLLFTPTVTSSAVNHSALLSFDELITLYKHETPPEPLAHKLATLLETPFVENNAETLKTDSDRSASKNVLRVAHWNIERGMAFEDIRAALGGREVFAQHLSLRKDKLDPKDQERALEEAQMFSQADVIVLNEVDWGLKRSDYRNIAKELAAALGMNYAFGVEFVEVDPLTLGTDKLEGDEIENREELLSNLAVDRERTVGLHGNAILSRYPLKNVRIVRFQTQGHDWFEGEKKQVSPLEKGKRKTTEVAFLERVMREVRRGGRMMLMAEIEDTRIPGGRATIVNAHLEAKTKPSNRRRQLEEVLTAIKPINHPVILAGDLNTSGSDATPTSVRREITKRLGSASFWAQYGIKWATGVGLLYDTTRTAVNFSRVYSDPTVRSIKFISENKEAEFFRTLEDFRFADGGAFDFRGDSQRSADGRAGKLANSNERAGKGFKPTYEPERSFKIARLKLDWIFVKPPGLTKPEDETSPYLFSPHYGRTLQALNYCLGERISDHNPMIVDLPFTEADTQAKK